MHTGYYFGFFLAAVANFFIGAHYGWRVMFIVGALPALLVAFYYNRIHEPERWQARQEQLGQTRMFQSFALCFQPEYRRRTILNSLYILASISGLWAGSAYVPAAITELARNAGQAAEGPRLASWSGAILAIGTIIGAMLSPLLADWLGRRVTLAIFFATMLTCEVLAFGYIFYMGPGALNWFLVCTFFLGLGGASFAVYSFWLPEQYRTECRVSAFAFATNVGRFVGALISLTLAWGIQRYGTIGKPVAITGLFFAVALLLLPFGEETKGKGLPT